MELKRYAVKYVRDKVKSNYPEKTECEICGSTEELHFHHFHSVAQLWNKWVKEQGYVVENVDQVMIHREEFIEQHWYELVDNGACLCKAHHEKLHKIYGKDPKLVTAGKQERWVAKQRDKLRGS